MMERLDGKAFLAAEPGFVDASGDSHIRQLRPGHVAPHVEPLKNVYMGFLITTSAQGRPKKVFNSLMDQPKRIRSSEHLRGLDEELDTFIYVLPYSTIGSIQVVMTRQLPNLAVYAQALCEAELFDDL